MSNPAIATFTAHLEMTRVIPGTALRQPFVALRNIRLNDPQKHARHICIRRLGETKCPGHGNQSEQGNSRDGPSPRPRARGARNTGISQHRKRCRRKDRNR